VSDRIHGLADRDAARVAATTRSIAVLVASVGAVWLLAIPWMYPLSVISVGTAAGAFVGPLAALALVQRGRARVAAIVLVASIWSVLAAPILAGGGIHSPIHSGFAIPILIAGLLLGGRAALGVALATVTVDGVIALLTSSPGIETLPPIPNTPLRVWAGHASFFVLTAALVAVASLRIRAAFRSASESERALRISEERHRQLAEHASDLIAEWSNDGRCRYVSPNVREKLGDTPEEFVAGLAPDRFDPASLAELRRALAESIGVGRAGRGVLRVRHRDGAWLSFEVEANPFESARGERGVVVIARDVTARVRADEERARLLKAMEQAGEGIVMLDPAGVIRYTNSAFARVFGRSVELLVGEPIERMADDQEDDRLLADIRDRLQTGETWRGRYDTLWRDGSSSTRDATVSPVRDGAGALQGYVGVIRDVTREARLEAELRQSQKLEAVGRLAGGVAHDFNNLLTAIAGCAETLLETLPPGSEEHAAAQEIGHTVDRSAALTRQLLAFARGQESRPRVIEANHQIAELERLLARLLGADVALHLELDPAAGWVEIDPGQLEQVIVNLAVNARDAMPEGGTLRVATGVERSRGGGDPPSLPPGEYVRVRVSDSGVGMDEATQARVFEPFFTTKEPGRGTGLGLALVHGVVHQAKGAIRMRTQPGRGACFEVLLPRVDGARSESDGPPGAPTSETHAPLDGVVLLVEDEQPVRELARRALEGAGLRVLSAASGREALDLSDRHDGAIDALVSDLVMPNMSGAELARALLARRPGLHVIFMSGYPDPARVGGGELPRHVAFLRKPFRPSDLRRELTRLLGARA